MEVSLTIALLLGGKEDKIAFSFLQMGLSTTELVARPHVIQLWRGA